MRSCGSRSWLSPLRRLCTCARESAVAERRVGRGVRRRAVGALGHAPEVNRRDGTLAKTWPALYRYRRDACSRRHGGEGSRVFIRRSAVWLVALEFLAALSPLAVLANDAPTVNISGPRYVPVSSVSPRTYIATDFDNDSTSMARTLACGSQSPVASGDWFISGQEWFSCSFGTPGMYHVGVHAQDSDGARSAAFVDVVATTRVRSVADGNLVATGHTAERPFGGALAFVDLNGDGKAELATGIARPMAQPQSSGVRSVHVLFGRTAGGAVDDSDYTGTTGFLISGTADELDFGTSIANAGDINGDGYQDIIINSPAEENQSVARAYVVFGRSNISSLTPATMTASQGFRISAPGLGFDIEVAGGADINGDGYSDVVVGTPGASLGMSGAPGAAFVVYGKAHPSNVDLSTSPSAYGAELAGSTYNAGVGQSWRLAM